MKKYFAFIISFILLYFVFQIGTGLLLTNGYTPNMSSIGGNHNQQVEFGFVSGFPLLLILMIATLAYFISQKLVKS
ncbi:hypothetical protein [Oceanobacillus sp. CF4.6]|uniref:hypothetical protein n=1 Tax=Oceanobacillus sp. CF4.6 TaxID=3373080 RepID=UPI003EE76119